MADILNPIPVMLPPLSVCQGLAECAHYGATASGKSADAYLKEEIGKVGDPNTNQWAAPLDAFAAAGVAWGGAMATMLTGSMALGPLAPLAAVAGFFAIAFTHDNKRLTIIFVNYLEDPLEIDADTYINCGIQTGYPAYIHVDPKTKNPVISTTNEIPALKFIGSNAFGGVGILGFAKDMAKGFDFRGTGGVFAFSSQSTKLPKKIAVAWLIPEGGGGAGCAVTDDLAGYGSASDEAGRREKFFTQEVDNKTPRKGVSRIVNTDGSADIHACMGIAADNKTDDEHIILTIQVG